MEDLSLRKKERCKAYKRKRSRAREFRGSKERLRLKYHKLQSSFQEAAQDNALLKDKEAELKKQNMLIKR